MSPESQSLWQVKPWWCQPWSIILTGIVIPSVVWFLTQRLWLVLPVVPLICAWWFVFLYFVPKQYTEATSLQREPESRSSLNLK
jgi:hypothetical protein